MFSFLLVFSMAFFLIQTNVLSFSIFRDKFVEFFFLWKQKCTVVSTKLNLTKTVMLNDLLPHFDTVTKIVRHRKNFFSKFEFFVHVNLVLHCFGINITQRFINSYLEDRSTCNLRPTLLVCSDGHNGFRPLAVGRCYLLGKRNGKRFEGTVPSKGQTHLAVLYKP